MARSRPDGGCWRALPLAPELLAEALFIGSLAGVVDGGHADRRVSMCCSTSSLVVCPSGAKNSMT
jgi:hypothetical protein